MTPINSVSRLEERMKDCVEKGKIEEAKIINRDSFGAAHRIMVRGEAEAFLSNKKNERVLRKTDLDKPNFIENVRKNLGKLLRADLKNHVLFRHLESGQSTPMVEESLYWDIETLDRGKVLLPPQVAHAIFQSFNFLHNLSSNAHRPYPLFLDGYSVGHATRVAIYSALMAERIKDRHLDSTQAAKAGFFHDIGKMQPQINALVRLPGKLSDSEYEKVKLHPVIGAATWTKLYDEAETASEGIVDDDTTFRAILEHHLRPDGEGYPSYLDGTNNSLIVKVARAMDPFDAMTTKRKYDKPRPDPIGYAREEMRRCSDLEWDKTKTDRTKPERQFDADIVLDFLDLNLAPVLRKAA